MSDRPEIEIQRQTTFGDDSQPEVTEKSVETSLEDFGVDVDHRDYDVTHPTVDLTDAIVRRLINDSSMRA